jgi:hypothetical protein
MCRWFLVIRHHAGQDNLARMEGVARTPWMEPGPEGVSEPKKTCTGSSHDRSPTNARKRFI